MLIGKTAGVLAVFTLALGIAPETMAQIGNCRPAVGEAYLDVNNVRARLLNNGNLFWRGDPSVYEVPKGGGANAIFNSGIWVGGMVGGQLRVAATQYAWYQFWAGPLDELGAPPADCAEYDRMYKVSRSDIEEYEATGVATPDLSEWPTGLGAPTLAPPGNRIDDDSDGETDEEDEQVRFDITVPLAQRKYRVVDLNGGERPALLGDQSVWWIMNDRGNEHLAGGADTPPIGLEVHALAFAFDSGGDIGNTTFYKYDLFYKGDVPLTDTYIGLYSDPDLGNYQDDWIGSDTLRGMGFVWNSDNEDEGGDGYGIPPALGYDFFQGPIVPSPGDTAYISGTPRPDFKNLTMKHFVHWFDGPGRVNASPFNGQHYYNYLSGRWKDGTRITLGGHGVVFSDIPTDIMFPGDTGSGPASCQFWSECNFDDAGTPRMAFDRRFVMSSGPFTINPNDYQQVVFGIVWAQGENNYDSVQKLKIADELAQAAFDVNFDIPDPPNAPNVTATALDGRVILEWTNSANANNYLEGYRVEDPFAPVGNNEYVFEGYTVYQYDNALDQVGSVIANYDMPNGITRVIDGIPGEPTMVTAWGTDSGVQTYHTIGGLTNYTTYYFGVQAYAYNDASSPNVYRGPIARIEVIPARSTRVVSEAALEAARSVAADVLATHYGIGNGTVYASVVNPGIVQDGTYTVEFYEAEFGKRPDGAMQEKGDIIDPLPAAELQKAQATAATSSITYDIKRDGTVIFDGSAGSSPAPQRVNVILVDGFIFSVLGPTPGFKDFQTSANAAGPLDPPDYGAFGWAGFPDPRGLGAPERGRQQSTNNSRWGFHAGGASSGLFGPRSDGSTFLGRATRAGLDVIGITDYEMRFTQRCADGIDGVLAPGDCLAWLRFQGGGMVEVPYELWQTGVSTPDDPSDDVRMVAVLLDVNVEGVYDIGGDHPSSSADDDPFTDWTYWMRPEDVSPGEAGHDAFFAGEGSAVEVLARTVLVVHNGGTAPPYNPSLPETGTVFRLVTNKPNQPGDVFTLSTVGLGAQEPDQAAKVARLDDIGIVPNPYRGASEYEVSQFSDQVRFTNMPDAATIRIFTLNGTLIKTIEKQSPGVATISWNLTTDHNLPIASGMYLIHFDVPNVGTKVLKFAVVKKRIQLNVY